MSYDEVIGKAVIKRRGLKFYIIMDDPKIARKLDKLLRCGREYGRLFYIRGRK